VLANIYPSPITKSLHSRCQNPRKPRPENVQQTAFKAKPIHGIYENVINSLDGCKQIIKPDEWRNSVHGVITGKFKDDNGRRIRILMRPNIVPCNKWES